MITKEQIKTLKKDLPNDWRIRVHDQYKKAGQSIPMQRLTDLASGKIKNEQALTEFVKHLKAAKVAYIRSLKNLYKLIEA